MMKIALMASGRGSNARALLEAKRRGELPACEFCLILSNVEGAAVLELGAEFGLSTLAIPHRGLKRAAHEALVLGALEQAGAEAIALAGYMRVLTGDFIARFPRRILNIHPSLLPAFPGVDAQRQAWDYGAKVAGCSVHFVEEGVDTGPIVLQAAVDASAAADPAALAALILAQEHRLYPRALDLFSRGKLRIEGRRVIVE